MKRGYKRRRPFRKTIKRYIPRKLYQLGRSVQYLKKAINVERKYYDYSVAQSINSTGSMLLLNTVGQGDSVVLRDGNSIKCVSMHMQFYVAINASATHTLVRLMLIRDKQSGLSPGITDVLANSNVNSFRNLVNGKRFQVLYDRRLQLDKDEKDSFLITYNKKCQQHFVYDGTSSTPNTNRIYLLLLSSEATNTPTIGGYFRMRFVDN